MVTDLFISRWLAARGIKQFSRNTILALTDKALSEISSQQPQDANSAQAPRKLGSALKRNIDAEVDENLINGQLSISERDNAVYSTLFKIFRESSNDGASNSIPLLRPLKVVQQYFMKTFCAPLINERLRTGHNAFRTYSGFMDLIHKIPLPPYVVNGGHLAICSRK